MDSIGWTTESICFLADTQSRTKLKVLSCLQYSQQVRYLRQDIHLGEAQLKSWLSQHPWVIWYSSLQYEICQTTHLLWLVGKMWGRLHCSELLRMETSHAYAMWQSETSLEGQPQTPSLSDTCTSQLRSSFITEGNRYITLTYLYIRNKWVNLLWQETWLGLNKCISLKIYMINRWYLPIIITINHIYNLCFDAAHHSPCLFHFLWDGSSFGKPSQCPSIHLKAKQLWHLIL